MTREEEIRKASIEHKQEDKELLLKDLSARLPYGVKVESVFINPGTKEHKSCGIEVFDATSLLMLRDGLGEFKPYLFPLSSMTEEQKKEYRKVCELDTEILSKHPMDGTPFPVLYHSQDWLNKNHFDYRDLISKGLAIDATGLNIY